MERYEQDHDFMTKIKPYIEHPEYQKLKNNQHHHDSVYNHTLRVSYLAYKIGKKLSKHPTELLRSALFHDLYFHDWHDKEFIINHGWTHPKIAAKNAALLFGPLSEREQNAISSHMWPLSFFNPPRFREAFIVAFSDKTIAFGEVILMFFNWIGRIFRGESRKKHLGNGES
jgi:uncharacterized protein